MKVVNVMKVGWNTDAVYVGRKRHQPMHFGNPFTHLPAVAEKRGLELVDTREMAVECFEAWLKGDKGFTDIEPARRNWILRNLHTLKGKDLACFCAPLACHAESLMHYANREDITG